MLPGIIVIWMHLDRQILLGINEFDENRQPVSLLRVGTQVFRCSRITSLKRRPSWTPSLNAAGAVRMGRALPGFRQRF